MVSLTVSPSHGFSWDDKDLALCHPSCPLKELWHGDMSNSIYCRQPVYPISACSCWAPLLYPPYYSSKKCRLHMLIKSIRLQLLPPLNKHENPQNIVIRKGSLQTSLSLGQPEGRAEEWALSILDMWRKQWQWKKLSMILKYSWEYSSFWNFNLWLDCKIKDCITSIK